MISKRSRPTAEGGLTPEDWEEIRIERRREDRAKEQKLEMERSQDAADLAELAFLSENVDSLSIEDILNPPSEPIRRVVQIPCKIKTTASKKHKNKQPPPPREYWSTRFEAEDYNSLVWTVIATLERSGTRCIGYSGMPDLVERLAELGVSPVAVTRKKGYLRFHKPSDAPLYCIAKAADIWLAESSGEVSLKDDPAPSAQALRTVIAQQTIELLHPRIESLLDEAMAIRAQPFHAYTSHANMTTWRSR